MIIDYVVADPVGNITVLVNTKPTAENRQDIIRKAFELEPTCEQVGFISRESDHCVRLEMMGYEFCGNATLSTACYQAFLNRLELGAEDNFKIISSGIDTPIDVKVRRLDKEIHADGNVYPAFSASLRVARPVIDTADKYPVVHLNGISHMLIPENEISHEEAEAIIKDTAKRYGVPAFGIILYKKLSDSEVEISPLVYVPESNTLVWEHGCASGSTATGYYLHELTGTDSVTINQSGGAIKLDIKDELYLTATVFLK